MKRADRLMICWVAAIAAVAWSAWASAQVLVLDDSLQEEVRLETPERHRVGGTFADGGFKITGQYDAIYWHPPYPIYRGTAEFYVRGMNPNECRYWMDDKIEIYHMYDAAYGDADVSYGGYRDNPYKHFIRKIGCNGGTTDAMELVWKVLYPYEEPDTSVLGWNPNTAYCFREKWYPDGSGNSVIEVYRDGQRLRTMSVQGCWNPQIPTVRIGASSRRMASYGAPLDAVYSAMKVWDDSTVVPETPLVTAPASGGSTNQTSPRIIWAYTPTSKYQVRLNGANDPNSSVIWDSGPVISSQNWCIAGPVAAPQNYYVFVRLWNGAGWGAWSANGHRITVNTGYNPPNKGLVTDSRRCFQDNDGAFLGLGATYMRGLRDCKYDRDLFRSNCAFLASHGFDYIRILSMVSWYPKEIMPIDGYNANGDEVDGWPDYWQQFRDMIDIAHDEFGLRTQVTIFADAQNCMPNEADRYTHMDRILADVNVRGHKVLMLEVANEFYQNGLTVSQLREYGAYLAARTNLLIALSSSGGGHSLPEIYAGSAADMATEHFSRDIGTFEGGWLPVRDCWSTPGTPGLPHLITSNEPIGPGSSVQTENDPIKLVSAAYFAWISGLGGYVFHSTSGVAGDRRFETLPGVREFRHSKNLLPPDLPNWIRNDGKESSAPFTVYCDGFANQYWTDPGRSGATTGCHRNIGGTKCLEFVCYPQGIRSGGLTLQARKDMSFTVYSPLTGAVVQTRTMTANQSFTLAQGPGAYLIKGTFPGTNTAPPGPVVKFAVNPGDGQNVLSWRNPSDSDFWATKVVCRTDRYPISVSDGTVICDRIGVPGSGDYYTHAGLTNGQTCYYAAFAYDCTPNYSPAATASGTPLAKLCYSEGFVYPDGSLNGNDGWSGSATSQIQIATDAVVIFGGAGTFTADRTVYCADAGNGYIKASVMVHSGAGDATMWALYFDDSSGRNLARWYGKGTTARGRIGGTSDVTAEQPLTGGWDSLVVKIYPGTNLSEFILNGTSIGTLSHTVTGASDELGRIRFERIDNAAAEGHYVFFDNLIMGEPTQPGDFDGDNDVDQTDFGYFQVCLTDDGIPYAAGCTAGDLDLDQDVDGIDLGLFLPCWSGPGIPADAGCLN